MKKVLILTALLAATTAHAITWLRTYGGSGLDFGTCVHEVEDGYIVTGQQEISSGVTALWLLKTDTSGNVIWSKTYRATDTTEAWGNYVQQTSDGGYILTGVDWRGYSQIWVLKTDAEGDTVWARNFGKSQGFCVQEIEGEGYIVTGRKEWDNSRLFLLKTNLNGDSVWMLTYLPEGWSYSRGLFVQQTDESGYIITGIVGDTAFETGKEAVCLVKTDANGDTLWTLSYGGEEWFSNDVGQCVRQTRDKDYIVAGILRDHAFLLKVNTQGDTVWNRIYGFNQASCCIEKKEKEEYVLTGDATRFLALSAVGSSWLLGTNSNGDSIWSQTYGNAVNLYVQETRDKGFIVTGGNGDLFLLKTDSLGLMGVTENPIVENDNGWKVTYPIGSYIVLHYKNLPHGFHAKVYDVSGRQIDEIRGDGNEGAMTWGINQPPGVYFIQALDNRNQLKTAKVVLVR